MRLAYRLPRAVVRLSVCDTLSSVAGAAAVRPEQVDFNRAAA
jgi:hypothetical protein